MTTCPYFVVYGYLLKVQSCVSGTGAKPVNFSDKHALSVEDLIADTERLLPGCHVRLWIQRARPVIAVSQRFFEDDQWQVGNQRKRNDHIQRGRDSD